MLSFLPARTSILELINFFVLKVEEKIICNKVEEVKLCVNNLTAVRV